MVYIFKKEICNYCKNTQCEKNKIKNKIDIDKSKNMVIYKCTTYIKDKEKIIPPKI